jgi:DNA-3-methyladenine glycosylase
MTIASGGGGPPSDRVLSRALLSGDSLDAARCLIGARLVHELGPADGAAPDSPNVTVAGRIVEVEAYVGTDDRASHARMGRTPRNGVMFGRAGIAYVYLVYGMHYCLNVVTGPDGVAAAVLVRAVEPIEGMDAVRAMPPARAPTATAVGGPGRSSAVPDHRLASGPGLVGRAFAVDRFWTGVDLCDPSSPLRLEARPTGEPAPRIVATPRIGIAFAGHPWTDVPWRFVDADSRSVSRAA